MARTNAPISDGLNFRSFGVAPATLNSEQRAVEIIAATEAPVLMPDWDRMEMVPEVLLMAGVKLPNDRTVPLLNSHQRGDALDVIGSAKELRTNGGQLVARAVVSSAADGIWTRISEGHLRDLSVGYRVDKKRFVPDGKTERIAGRDFAGPVNVATSWTVREVSVTPIGADEQAKMRGLQANPFDKEKEPEMHLSAEQRAALVGRGMPAETDDAAAVQWAIDNLVKVEVERKAESKTPAVDAAEIAKLAAEQVRKDIKAAREAEKLVRKLCAERRLSADATDKIAAACDTEDEARKAIWDYEAENRKELGSHISFGPERSEKFAGAIGDALSLRMLQATGKDAEKWLPAKGRHDGYTDFRNASLFDLASQCVEAEGYPVRRMTKEDVARIALGCNPRGQWRAERAGGFHNTAAFPYLTLDAMNKSLIAAYQETPSTWRTVFKQAASVPDFKNIHRIRLSEHPNLAHWPDNTVPENVTFTDEREYYAVEAYSNICSFTWRMLVNDDMDALSRIPMLQGAAAARTVNAAVWSVVTSNPTMADGQALFLVSPTGNRKKSNAASAAVISETTLNAARALFRLQVGVNTKAGNASASILNLTPQFLVVPAAIEGTARRYVASEYLPEANLTQVVNQWKGLTVVVEPLLDGNSASIWYMFARPSDIDTIELSFLQGHETPVTDDWTDEETSARKYRITQTFGAKAIDFRGCFGNGF